MSRASSKFYGCVECHRWLHDQVYHYSINHFGAPLCRPCQNKLRSSNASSEAQALYLALRQQGIPAKLEWSDGYKTIDIAIPDYRIYIEVDGKQHRFSNKQALSDLWRTFYAYRDGITTLRIPNSLVQGSMTDTVESLLKFFNINNHRGWQARG